MAYKSKMQLAMDPIGLYTPRKLCAGRTLALCRLRTRKSVAESWRRVGNWWIEEFHWTRKPEKHSVLVHSVMVSTASTLSGYCSLFCWLVVFTPQLWENYRRKSTDGLSLGFILIWLLGDVFSVAGAVMQHLLNTVIILGVYYALVELVLLYQMWIYRHPKTRKILDDTDDNAGEDVQRPLLGNATPPPRYDEPSRSDGLGTNTTSEKRTAQLLAIGGIFLINGITPLYINHRRSPVVASQVLTDFTASNTYDMAPLAETFGYISAILYVGARVPQIYHNFRNKSCEGLSMLMFAFSVLGNATFFLSIILESTEPDWLYLNVPWLVGSGGTMLFDFVVLLQFYMYRETSRLDILTPGEEEVLI
ncbi:PQ loop repeat-domain-containing protein [Phlyctochytrium arcticum]|nr:PQ loop repeat-domain-containing protein [Phlyctochytrium arcticum]